MRLNKFLAAAGLGSRRSVEELIKGGTVRINGKVVTELATQVLPTDAVKVGSRLLRAERTIHAILNKPRGYLCTASDPEERKTIFHLLPPDWPRVHYVGRLDKESEGLLIITNDGDLTNLLTHPRHEVEKEYEVWLDKPFDSEAHRAKLLRGFRIEPGFAKCEAIESVRREKIRVVLRQGLKRQIRLMFYAMGYEVERLVRVRIGPITTGTTAPGTWRLLSQKEVAGLREGAAPKKLSES
jgi:23S rRNA pseudouridine2605 synthase